MPRSDPDRTPDLARLRWQVEMGAVEGIANAPLDRFRPEGQIRARPAPAAPGGRPRPGDRMRTESAPAATSRSAPDPRPPPAAPDPERPESREAASAGTARAAAEGCDTIEALHRAIETFEGSPLRAGARRTVISDGNPKARVMIIGEAPGAEEDRLGRPFVGKAGELLDRALSQIGLARGDGDPQKSFYITNIVYWRPPGNRTPTPEEALPLMPFCERHILLAEPEILLLLGNVAGKNLLRTSTGITRLRGSWKRWTPSGGGPPIPALPTFHPAYLLRTPKTKRLFWRDLLSLRARLDGGHEGDHGGDPGAESDG